MNHPNHPFVRCSVAVLLASAALRGCTSAPDVTTVSQDARRAYVQGVAAYEKFYYTEAESLLGRAVRLDSTFAMAWGRLANISYGLDNERQARTEVDRAMALAGGTTRREQLYIRLWSHMVYYQAGEALRTADTLVQEFPGEKEPFLTIGRLKERGRDLEGAIKAYQKAISIDSGYALAVMSLGYAYSTAGDQDRAITEMQRYITLAPDAADPRASYADLLFRVGDYAEALKQYRASLSLKPDYWYSLIQIGNIDVVYGRLTAAGEEFGRAIRALPRNPEAEAGIIATEAGLSVQRGDYQRALALYERALRMDSTNTSAAYGTVKALTEMKQFEEAENGVARIRTELASRNLLSSGAMVGFHLMRARLALHEGRPDDAQVACDSAAVFANTLSRSAVCFQLAEIHLARHEYEEAIDACEEGLSVNRNNPLGLLVLAKVYNGRGDRSMTRELGERLLQFWSDADPDYKYLVELKHLLGASA